MDVSRETCDALDAFEELVRKWSSKINLVSKASLSELRTRHIQDSIQLFNLIPDDWSTWYDFGSGGGFPGIVVATIAKYKNPKGHVTLVESDQRKATFLRTAVRELELNADVIPKRIEDITLPPATVISARALAPLPKLISMSQPFMSSQGHMVFPKGKRWKEEVELACQEWSFSYDVIQSLTAPDAVILKINEVRRA